MKQSIDVLLIDPCSSDSKRTVAGIRRKAPNASTLRVLSAEQAARLMFEQGLFTKAPQRPSLIIVDLAAAGESAKAVLRRIANDELTARIPLVIFTSQRNPDDLLQCHLLGAHMNIVKPTDPVEYSAAVERIIAMWLSRAFIMATLEERQMQGARYDAARRGSIAHLRSRSIPRANTHVAE
jgi:response regulator RpfG family c-di-GMP phosphodiesterase